jgi:hypothetical protein
MAKIEVNPNETDGSRRLLAYARQCKKFGIVGSHAVRLIRQMAEQFPFPKNWTDEQILKRIDQADVNPGESCDEQWKPHPMPEFVEPESKPERIAPYDTEKRLVEFAFGCGGIIGDYIEHSLDTAKRPQPIYALAGAISLVSVLIGRKVRDEFGTRPNVQLICVGKTSSGKDHARCLNTEILSGTGNENLLAPEEFTSDSAVYRTLAEHPCRIFHLDEFGRFLQAAQNKNNGHMAGVVTAMMKVYTSAGSPSFRPKSYANKKDHPDMAIQWPHITLLATSTPEAVYEGIGSSMIDDGFLGRCLIFESSEQPRLHISPEKAFPWNLRGFAEGWRDNDDCFVLTTSDEALGVFAEYENKSHDLLVAGGKAAGLWGRFSQKARQLAIVDACSRCDDCEPRTIGEESAKWGCELVELVTHSMARIADEWLSRNLVEGNVQRVLRLIRDSQKISRNQLTRRTQWLRKQEREEIIDTLISSGQIRFDECKDGRNTSWTFHAVKS